ncbi:MAG TPA: hypothetical protein VFP35_00810 [Candidatus Saccharimonadales bacterium]|nr:hypothetical protein [Candidatus Saccharimonadales bacterium]
MKNINIDQILKLARANSGRFRKHAVFAAILIVLFAYILVVWRISQLAGAEPADTGSVSSDTSIPKVDQKAISQIQSLEQASPQVHSLFNSARNNPFQE